MKLKDYVAHLERILHGGGGELEVIYAVDDEGNAFHPVYYAPTAGWYELGEFVGVTDEVFQAGEYEVNAVVVN
jgi:hypothetical protein